MAWMNGLLTIFQTASDVLTAGIAIVAFSLLLFAITFKNWEKVTIWFTMVMLSVMVIFGADAFVTAFTNENFLDALLTIHWSGLIFLPVFYFHFSDSLLTLTGKPSRGKRRITGYACLIIGFVFLALLVSGNLIGNYIIDEQLGIYFERTIINDLFSLFFATTLLLSWWNFIRVYQRTITKASRRRMVYLIISSLGPALGSFPYLLYGSQFALNNSMIFWLLSLLSAAFVFFSLIAMTYSVAFYGFPWPDRVIKSRLFRWVMRGPITASLTLGVTTLISRLGTQLSINVSALVVLFMVAVIVFFEFFVTLFAPIWERLFFYGKDKDELEKVRMLEDRLLTTNDIRQFLELSLATVCDRLQVSKAALIVSSIISNDLDTYSKEYENKIIENKEEFFSGLDTKSSNLSDVNGADQFVFLLHDQNPEKQVVLGAIVINEVLPVKLDEEKKIAIEKIISRVSLALYDRQQQEELVSSLDLLTPRVSVIQNLLATSRRDKTHLFNGNIDKIEQKEIEKWIKDALTHLWGGPKISLNPLTQLSIVQEIINIQKETPTNAVRMVLREAVNKLKPEGERQFTNEWILYNLLDLKFFEGWKVKDIARKLALSEADFYRKQRIAINSVTKNIIESERNYSSGGLHQQKYP